MAESGSFLDKMKLKQFPQPDIISLRYPVFFCHGFGAFGSLMQPSPLHHPCMLMRERGIIAFAPNITPYASIEIRAADWVQLIRQVCEQYGFRKLNIIAHSMGGLDIRYALANTDIIKNIASVTTVSTPHKGTYLADFVLKTPDKITEKLGELADWLGNNVFPSEKSNALEAVEQLSRHYIQEVFNPATPLPDIPAFSYSAAVGKATDHSLNPIFLFQNNLIYEQEGINDSFVSVESSAWAEHLGTVPLSHTNQINIQVSRENKPVYLDFWTGVAKTLQEKGF